MNPVDIIEKLNSDNKYLSYLCYEAGKKNKIFILVNSEDFHLIFKTVDKEYVDVAKTRHDIVNSVIVPSTTIGFDAKVNIQFKDMSSAIFRVKNRFEAIEIVSRMMCLPYSPDSPFTNCNAIQDKDQIKNNLINIDVLFSKRIKQKKIRFGILIFFIIIVISLIFVGAYFIAGSL